jgi:prolipoprotein diacylglyceryltransferase
VNGRLSALKKEGESVEEFIYHHSYYFTISDVHLNQLLESFLNLFIVFIIIILFLSYSKKILAPYSTGL